MSYLNQAHDPRRRATAIIAVGSVHVLLAAGLITGLAVDLDRIVETRLVGTNIPLPPPPPPSPTPSPPVDKVSFVPPAPAPAPRIDLAQTAGEVRAEVEKNDPVISLIPATPPIAMVQTAPSAALTPKRVIPRNGGWITNADYPRRALVAGLEGSVGYRLVVGTDGRVSSCELTRPSGHRPLDDATCRLIASRGRFDAATDETGAKILGTFTGSVTWEIPE